MSNLATAPNFEFGNAIMGDSPSILTDIYQDGVNLAIWERSLSDTLLKAADQILEANPTLQLSTSVAPDKAYETLKRALIETPETDELCKDMADLVDMFCCLFDLGCVGLRLTALDRAMCPRFHVDKVPCRLVSTYRGVGSQWLPSAEVDRNQLGMANRGKTDEETGLYKDESSIQQLSEGDVAFLKGELWEGNEGNGIVHRSPAIETNQPRLLMTLDFM